MRSIGSIFGLIVCNKELNAATTDMDVDMLKTERAEWLQVTLNNKNVPEYGRASKISRDLQCAKAAAHGWLSGALPRDMQLGFRFAEQYDFDVREWVMGSKQNPQTAEWEEAIKTARAFEKTVADMSDEQFMMIVKLAMTKKDDELGALINQLGTILKEQ